MTGPIVHLGCGTGAVYALFLLPFDRWMCLLTAIGLATILVVKFMHSQRQCYLLLTHSDEGWTFQSRHPAECVSGSLVQAGYRSAWLVILVIQSDDTALHRVTVWKDQVSSRQFSYLHQQLAFAAEPPTRRRPSLWLKDVIGMQPAKPRHHSGPREHDTSQADKASVREYARLNDRYGME